MLVVVIGISANIGSAFGSSEVLFILPWFLPAFSLRSPVARVTFALIALINYSVLVILAPNVFFGVVAFLVSVGIGGVVHRLIERFRGGGSRWWVTPLVAIVLIAVPAGVRSWTTYRFYERNMNAVTVAKDSARPQTRGQLAERVVDALDSTPIMVNGHAEDVSEDGMVGLWHPGPRKNGDFFMAEPDTEPEEVDAFEKDLRRILYSCYVINHGYRGDFGSVGSLGDWRQGDRCVAEWRGEVPLSALGGGRELLSYREPKRWDGENFNDGEWLFPGAKYYQLDVMRSRWDATEPFLTLYAVDDHGKWWLVGMSNPNPPWSQ